jgi:lysophospholipase L1-like esterase
LKFILANAFDNRSKDFLYEHCDNLANKVDWSCYIHDYRDYQTFAQLLVRKDNWLSKEMQPHYYEKYSNLDYPKKHLTNCIHPTIDGYKVIAEELADFIKEKYTNA